MPDDEPLMILHNPDELRSLAVQLRAEATRAEARAEKLTKEMMPRPRCAPGCWNSLSTCIMVETA